VHSFASHHHPACMCSASGVPGAVSETLELQSKGESDRNPSVAFLSIAKAEFVHPLLSFSRATCRSRICTHQHLMPLMPLAGSLRCNKRSS